MGTVHLLNTHLTEHKSSTSAKTRVQLEPPAERYKIYKHPKPEIAVKELILYL
jgi:hypothetical protein